MGQIKPKVTKTKQKNRAIPSLHWAPSSSPSPSPSSFFTRETEFRDREMANDKKTEGGKAPTKVEVLTSFLSISFSIISSLFYYYLGVLSLPPPPPSPPPSLILCLPHLSHPVIVPVSHLSVSFDALLQTIHLKVLIHCEGCKKKVNRTLNGIEGNC